MTEHKIVEGIKYKQCSRCNEFKTLDRFQKRKDSKDGYRDQCIDCIAILREARAKSPADITHKICSKCKQDKDISNFTLSSSSPDGYSYECKDCRKQYKLQNAEHIKQYNAAYRERPEVKEQMKAYHQQYRIDNPEKIKENNQKALQYYYENKEEILTRQKEYYEQNKEEINKKVKEKYKIKVEYEKQQKEQERLRLYNQGLKTCYVCRQIKPLDCFNKRKSSVDGLEPTCIECRNKRNTEIRANRKVVANGFKICSCCGEKLPVSKFRIAMSCLDGRSGQCMSCTNEKFDNYNKNLTPEQKEQRKQYSKEYAERHKEHFKKYREEYRKNNKEKLQEMEKIRYRKNKLNKNMSVAINKTLQGVKSERHWEDLVPYDLQKLREHLELQFTSEMSWDNYGSYWEVDHIIPQNLFNISSKEDKDFQICWSLANLRPLSKTENRQRPKDGSDISEELRQQILNQFNI